MPSYNDVPVARSSRRCSSTSTGSCSSTTARARRSPEQLDALAEETDAASSSGSPREREGLSGARRGRAARDGAGAVLVIDADGQHPAERDPGVPRGRRDAELVVGDRFGDLAEMPDHRRLANRTTRRLFELVTGVRCATRRTACGCSAAARSTAALRRLRGRDRHLRGCSARRARRVGPYPGDLRERAELVQSRAGLVAVLWALVRPLGRPTRREADGDAERVPAATSSR